MTQSIVNVETFGDPDGESLLAVHGISGFGARFGRLAERLPRRRWMCPDLRGHGSSPAHPPWRTEEHVADLVAVLDDAGIERADVVGHSFGGHLALHLLAAAPERVGKLVLLDPASMIDAAHAEESALDYAREPGWATEDEARSDIGSWFPEAAARDRDLEIERNLVLDEEGRWRMRFSPVVIVAAYGEMARPLPELPRDHDVLLLEADADQTAVNERLRDALQQTFAERLHRVVVPGGTHVIFRTHLDETAEALEKFLT